MTELKDSSFKPSFGLLADLAPSRRITLFIFLACLWTFVIGASFFQARGQTEKNGAMLAITQARTLIEKDIIYRRWNSNHGGVYVPVTNNTQPNPFLDENIPRDVATPDGEILTLINPAYMTRQVHELQKEEYGISGRLTSMKPLNPDNAPNKWEADALVSFENGEKEVSRLETIDGKPYLRLMKPLVTGEECLRCHAEQGYKVGDVRGGISVVSPLSSFYEAGSEMKRTDVLIHVIIWLTGLAGIYFSYGWITRSRAEIDLGREKMKSLALAVEQSPATVVITDSEGVIEYVNPKFTRLTGYSSNEAIGQNPRILKSELHPREYYTELWDVIKSGREWRGEFLNKKKNGELFWEYASISPLVDGDGNTTHFIGVKEDVTLRKQAEQEQKRQKEFIETVLNSIPDSISIVNVSDGRITGFNSAFRKESGLSEAEILNKHCYELNHSLKNICRPSDHSCPLLEINHKRPIEHVHLNAGGDEIFVEVSAFPIMDESGEVRQAVHVRRDITERKKAEKAILSAKEKAEEASRSKSEFLANLSHEFRTPMNGIIGMTELALDTELNPEQTDYLNLVKMSAEALQVLLNDILDFSKIEAGRLQLEQIDFDLKDCVEDAVHTLAFKAHGKGLEIILNIDKAIPEILVGDPGRLRQVLLNLLGNAVKFTHKGEIIVSAELEGAVGENLTLHFKVADTGIGIPREKQELIFSDFTQADSSTTRKYGGAGLGLAISSKLVDMFGGEIWVESEVGQGSTFHFTARFSVAKHTVIPEEHVDYRALDIENASVLIVDDNGTSRRFLYQSLTNWGMKPTACDNGTAGLEALKQAAEHGTPFSLVLLDSQMPEIDGFELASRIRSMPLLEKIPLLMLTSSATPGDAAKCRKEGIDGYIPKPVRQSELYAAIKTILEKPAARNNNRTPNLLTRHTIRTFGPRYSILAAEDNPVNQKLTRRVLEKHGHKVTVVSNGMEAVDAFKTGKYDLILMDIQMPEMDGMEAAALIRGAEKTDGDHIPIIAMTAYAMKGDRERFLKSGFDGYVAKPINPLELAYYIQGIQSTLEAGRRPSSNISDYYIEIDALSNRLENNVELMADLLETFLEDLPHRLKEIEKSALNADLNGIKTSAHSLKGAAGYFTDKGVFKLSHMIYEAADEGNMDEIGRILKDLIKEADRLKEAMDAWLNRKKT